MQVLAVWQRCFSRMTRILGRMMMVIAICKGEEEGNEGCIVALRLNVMILQYMVDYFVLYQA